MPILIILAWIFNEYIIYLCLRNFCGHFGGCIVPHHHKLWHKGINTAYLDWSVSNTGCAPVAQTFYSSLILSTLFHFTYISPFSRNFVLTPRTFSIYLVYKHLAFSLSFVPLFIFALSIVFLRISLISHNSHIHRSNSTPFALFQFDRIRYLSFACCF